MLPQPVLDEIFNVKYRVSDQALEYISDELDKFRCTISRIEDNDLAVTIYFGRNTIPSVDGEIRIDRIFKNFSITGICNGLILPMSGDWGTIIEYLNRLTCPIDEGLL